ncbi:unnamed protein product [Cuscuta campestris]|uniref:CCT domain-containing protein n=1 Tax=Cuscuta campestris TaxID=132261 RepID=A0A484NKG6_9ASTE|nr:unnamed protein product [Cuscuta campestris]
MLEFSESELFPETLQISEVGSSSNGGGGYEEHSSYSTHLPLTPDVSTFDPGCGEMKNQVAAANQMSVGGGENNHLSIIFDTGDDLSASIDFGQAGGGGDEISLPPQFLNGPAPAAIGLEQFDISLFENHHVAGGGGQQYPPPDNQIAQLMAAAAVAPPQMGCEEECLSSAPSYLHNIPSCSFLDPSFGNYLTGNLSHAALSGDNSGICAGGGYYLGADLPPPPEFQGDNNNNRLFCPDNIPRVYNCHTDPFQAIKSENQHLVSGGSGGHTALASNITCLEDTTFKVGKLSVEERKERIHRYLQKRKDRNFDKKIKYQCRKTLADNRPRVRGRFAKNDDLGEVSARALSSITSQEDDTLGDVASRHNFLYDPNYPAALPVPAATGGRRFNSNCLLPPGPVPGPYDICNTLFFADPNMQR